MTTALMLAGLVVVAFFSYELSRQLRDRTQKLIDALQERLLTVERCEPKFTEVLAHAVPVPLMRLRRFHLSLEDAFWLKVLNTTAQERQWVKDTNYAGPCTVRVTVEEWRGNYVVIRIHSSHREGSDEVRRSYPTSLDREAFDPRHYGFFHRIVLWKQELSDPLAESNGPIDDAEVRLGFWHNAFELYAVCGRFESQGHPYDGLQPRPEHLFLRVPVDGSELSQFLLADEDADSIGDKDLVLYRRLYKTTPWLRCYHGRDELRGLDWGLEIHDFQALANAGLI